jgi:2-phosphosulfolactate phosphatase
VAILCAGVAGELALDDVYCAGRIAAALGGTFSDGAVAASRIAAAFASPVDGIAGSLSARNLRDAGLDADIAWCARESVLDVVPRMGETVLVG